MRSINPTNLIGIRSHMTPLVAEALGHLDGLFDYLKPPADVADTAAGTTEAGTHTIETSGTDHTNGTHTIEASGTDHTNGTGLADANTPVAGEQVRADFSDAFTHTENARSTTRLVQIFGCLAAYAMWLKVTESVIRDEGEKACDEMVLHRMSGILAGRVLRNTQIAKLDPSAGWYMSTITEQLAGIVSILRTVVDAEPYVVTLVDTIAPTMGLTPAEFRDRLNQDDKVCGRALAEAVVLRAEDTVTKAGGTVDESTRQHLRDIAGLGRTGPFSPTTEPMDLGDALHLLGLNPADARETEPGVYVIPLQGRESQFTPPHAGSVEGVDHIRVG